MKNSNLTKILALTLSLALLICSIVAISASAESTEKSAKFTGTTLNYGAETRITYILELSGVSASDVTLKLYKNADLSDEPTVVGFSGEYYNESYPVFYSTGVSAKDLADYIYAVPYADGEKIGDTLRYSVAEYCYSVITDADEDADLVALAEDLIAYGASAQQRLINIGNIADETLVSEYNYAYTATEGVTLDGYKAGLYAPEAKVIPAYTGEGTVLGWKLVSDDGATVYDAAAVAEGIAITKSVEFVPLFDEMDLVTKVVADFEEGYIIDGGISACLTRDFGYAPEMVSENVSESETVANTTFSVVSDPENAANKVLKVVQTAGGNKFIGGIDVPVVGDGNCYVFEAKIRTDSTSVADYIFAHLQLRSATYNAKCSSTNATADINVNLDLALYSTLIECRNNGASTVGIQNKICDLTADTWMDLKIEYYKSAVAEENYVKVYIGNTLVHSGNYVDNVSEDAITHARIYFYGKTAATTYYDDISFTAIEKEYSAE